MPLTTLCIDWKTRKGFFKAFELFWIGITSKSFFRTLITNIPGITEPRMWKAVDCQAQNCLITLNVNTANILIQNQSVFEYFSFFVDILT